MQNTNVIVCVLRKNLKGIQKFKNVYVKPEESPEDIGCFALHIT